VVKARTVGQRHVDSCRARSQASCNTGEPNANAAGPALARGSAWNMQMVSRPRSATRRLTSPIDEVYIFGPRWRHRAPPDGFPSIFFYKLPQLMIKLIVIVVICSPMNQDVASKPMERS
jgi:hypothetical protein